MFGKKAQPKEEHPMQTTWDQIGPDEKPKFYKGIEFPLGRSGYVPPSGDNPLLNRPANPALDVVYGTEKREIVLRMVKGELEYSEYYMAPVAQLAEELCIPPISRGEDQR